MNAPLFFLLVPVASAGLAFLLFPLHRRAVIFFSALLSAGLAWSASAIPLDAPLTILNFTFPVSGSFSLLGRQLVFDPSLRSALVFLFFGGAALFGGSLAIPPNRLLLPAGFVVLSLLSASLFVQPFLYAAFFLLFYVLVFSILLSDESHPVPRGAVRWIAYSTLGMLFLLLAGSEMSVLNNQPVEAAEMQSLLFRLCLGFGLLLSVPPFHFWLPDVVDDSSPYSVSLILSLYIGGVVFFLLRFLDEIFWLRASAEIFLALQIGGAGMCLVGAVFSVFQERFGRCVGYLSLCNLGVILLGLSVLGPSGVQTTMILLAARGFSLLVWGVSFQALRPKQASDSLEDMRGVAASRPFAFSAALLSALSLVGTPGLMTFPPFWAVLTSFANRSSSGLPALFISLAMLLPLAAGVLSVLRFAHPMLHYTASKSLSLESGRFLRFFFILSIVLLLVLGLLPQLYIPWVAKSAGAFVNLLGTP
jgi:NADH:ubiquinone oxidoreductase subunit 4 (subunit M)